MTTPKQNELPRPKLWVAEYNRRYPVAWQMADHFRSLKGSKELERWPNWCFLPIAAAVAIVESQHGVEAKDAYRSDPATREALLTDPAIVAALYAWRATQNIYRFDPELFLDLAQTPLDGDIPHEILYRLPDWCVYIDLNPDNAADEPIRGLFAHLEYDFNDDRTELRFLIDADDPETGGVLIPVVIHLGPWSIAEAIARTKAVIEQNNKTVFGAASTADEFWGAIAGPITAWTSLLLYICSENADIDGLATRPARHVTVKKTKKGPRIFPPDQPRVWDVGVRLGSALRRARVMEEAEMESAARSHQSPRPHVRRAHWHTYRVGPKRANTTLKWLPPIPVNIDDLDALPAVIRPVG